MPRYQFLPRRRRLLRCCDWAVPTSWFNNCGRNWHWLPIEWTLTWHGLPMRCWLVIPCFMLYIFMFIGLLVFCFSRSFWTGCNPASFLACLVGWRHMGSTALSMRSAAQMFWWRGRGPHFDVFVWRCWADSAPILLWRLRSWPKILMLLVPIHLLCLCKGSSCAGRDFCKLFGKCVPCEARGISHVWSPAIEALHPANCCIRVWEPGFVFHDGVRDKSFEGSRVSGLDGV